MHKSQKIHQSPQQKKILEQQKLFTGKEEGIDYVTCHYCPMISTDLTSHINRTHKISPKEYAKHHPLRSQSYLQKQSERVKGSKNPAYQHGGRLSPFSKRFLRKDHDPQHTILKAKKIRMQNKSNNTTLEYWMKKTGGDVTAAKKLLISRQKTFFLEKCIQKYGEIEGRRRWEDRQTKWMINYKKQNYSKISQELFFAIMHHYQSDHVYFAQWNREDMEGYQNKEYRLRLSSGKTVLPDFIDLTKRKIIEFDGQYWHGQKKANPKREKEREEAITKNGYLLLRISEQEYKQNTSETIQKCLRFLIE